MRKRLRMESRMIGEYNDVLKRIRGEALALLEEVRV